MPFAGLEFLLFFSLLLSHSSSLSPFSRLTLTQSTFSDGGGEGVRAYPGNVCLLGWAQREHRGVEMEYGEGQRDHEGSKGSEVILLWVREDFPGDGAVQADS